MKKKGAKLFASFAAPICAILAFVGFAFKFAMEMSMGGYDMSLVQLSFKDWNEYLKWGGEFGEKVGVWKASRVMMIILLVLLAVLAVLVLIQLFLQNNILRTITKVVGIVSLILAIIFPFVFSLGGMMASVPDLSKLMENLDDISIMMPNLGPMWIALWGFVGSIFGLVAIKRPKAKVE